MRPALLVAVSTLFVFAAAVAGPAAAKTVLPGFRSPSGNITCFVVRQRGLPGIALCQIAQANYAKRLEAYCASPPIEVDWAGFSLGETKAGSVSCSGGVLYDSDSERPGRVTLPYGKSWQRGTFTCWSRVTGITCRNRQGHGLFISRESWRAW